jgi:hypothetical protein
MNQPDAREKIDARECLKKQSVQYILNQETEGRQNIQHTEDYYSIEISKSIGKN